MHAYPAGVLVVEDEALILNLLLSYCRAFGATAYGARDAESAERVLRDRSAEISGALIDLCLPDADGLATRRRLAQIKPGLRCCLMSGMPMGNAPVPEGFVHTMDKPFRGDDVRRCLGLLLGGATPEVATPLERGRA